MSFYFNWAYLDETAAEAIRLLINDKLGQILDDRLKAMNTGDSFDTNKINSGVSGLGGVNSSLDGSHLRSRVFNVNGEHGGSEARAGLTGQSLVNSQPHPTLIDSVARKSAAFTADSATNGDFRHQTPQHYGRHGSPGLSGLHTVSAAATTATTADRAALHASVSSKKIPLVSFLRIDNIKWGTMPPFIEIDRFENALDILDTAMPSGSMTSLNISTPGVSAPVGQMDHLLCDSLDSTEGSQMAYPSSVTVPPRDVMQRGKVAASSGGTFDTPPIAIVQEPFDNMNSISSTRNPEEGKGPSSKGSALSHRSARATSPHPHPVPTTLFNKIKTPYNYSEHEFPSPTSIPSDTLAPFLGEGGLYLRLHLTYGGSMSFSASTAIQYCINIGSLSLPVYMPIELHVSDFDLDCFICFNFHHNECRLWLEPGKLTDSVVNRLKVVAVFGKSKDGDDDLDTSTSELLRSSSSHLDDDDGSIFVDKREVEQLVVSEVKTFLQKKLMSPHFICIPIKI